MALVEAPPDSTSSPPSTGNPRTVLVVDDESVVRDVIVRYLRHEGFETLEAADGATARRLLETAESRIWSCWTS